MFGQVTRDIRYGTRCLIRCPGYSIAALGILALGIGSSVTIFSALHAVLIRPFGYADPDRLVVVWSWNTVHGLPEGSSYPNFVDWSANSRTLSAMSYYVRPEFTRVTLSAEDGAPERLEEGRVGPGFFELLGTPALLGRTISREEFNRGDRVAVLSEALWRRRFGASQSIIGGTILVDGQSYAVVGVMPGTFQLPAASTQIWRPISVFANWQSAARNDDGLVVLGRIAAGSDLDLARSEMTAITAALELAHPQANRHRRARVVSLEEHFVGSQTRLGLWFVFATALLLLLISCGNVAGLLTARGIGRAQEFGIRAALGGGRRRLVQQLLIENLVLGSAATALGLWAANIGVWILRQYAPAGVPRLHEADLNPVVVLVAVMIGMFTVIVFGVWPALRTATPEPHHLTGSRNSIGGRGRSRLQHVLVAGQVALATVVLIAASLLVHTFFRVNAQSPGFDADQAILMSVYLPPSAYGTQSHVEEFFQMAADRLESVPGVDAAGAVTNFFISRIPDLLITPELGRSIGQEAPKLTRDRVTPGFFRAAGVTLLSGRAITDADMKSDAPSIAVINQTMARTFWGDGDPIGKRFQFGGGPPSSDVPWTTVVGVVADARRQGQETAPIASIFSPGMRREMDLVVRVADDRNVSMPAILPALRAMDDRIVVSNVRTGAESLGQFMAERRFQTLLVMLFGLIGLILSAVGIYSLLAQTVAMRTREIGLRSVLGAEQHVTMTMFVRSGIGLAVAGMLAGTLAAGALSRTARSLLYEMSPLDPISYALAAMIVVGASAAASYFPARRASSVSPMEALRSD